MKVSQIGLNLYSLRDSLKTPGDIAQTLKKVRTLGYTAVQVSGLGPIDDKELKSMLNSEGLVCCATHEGGEKILDQPKAVVDRLNLLACKYTAYPWPHLGLDSLEKVKSLAKGLNDSGKVLFEAGQTLCYHNHAQEFTRYEGKTVMEIIYDSTDARYLQGEIDTYWVQVGGQDPAAWCRRLKGRLPLLHLKDYRVLPDGKVQFAEVGHGNLDFKSICRAAEDGGCKWFIVEQDDCYGDPFGAVGRSFTYMQEQLCA